MKRIAQTLAVMVVMMIALTDAYAGPTRILTEEDYLFVMGGQLGEGECDGGVEVNETCYFFKACGAYWCLDVGGQDADMTEGTWNALQTSEYDIDCEAIIWPGSEVYDRLGTDGGDLVLLDIPRTMCE